MRFWLNLVDAFAVKDWLYKSLGVPSVSVDHVLSGGHLLLRSQASKRVALC